MDQRSVRGAMRQVLNEGYSWDEFTGVEIQAATRCGTTLHPSGLRVAQSGELVDGFFVNLTLQWGQSAVSLTTARTQEQAEAIQRLVTGWLNNQQGRPRRG